MRAPGETGEFHARGGKGRTLAKTTAAVFLLNRRTGDPYPGLRAAGNPQTPGRTRARIFPLVPRPSRLPALILGVVAVFFLQPAVASAQEAITVAQAVEIAARHNPDILRARTSVEAASGRKLQAESFADSSLIYEPEEARDLNPGRFGSQKIGVRQRFELFGKRGLRGRIAAAGVQEAREELRRTVMLTTAHARRAYWAVAAQRGVVAHLESMRPLLDGLLEDTRARFEGGSASYADVARAKAEIGRLDNDLADARAELSSTKETLNVLLGRPGEAPVNPVSPLRLAAEKRSLEEIRAAALRERPSLRIAAEERRKAEDARRLARRSYLPDLDLTGSYQRVRTGGMQGAGVDNDWSGIVELTFPFPGAKRQRGLVQEANAGRARAEISQASSEREILAAIDRAYARLRAAEGKAKRWQDSLLPDAEDAFHAGLDAYRGGETDSLGVLDLYRSYKESQIAATRSILAVLLAQADLEVAGEEGSEKP